ncbi:MAG: hypothetical protein RDV41_11155 [Planctomycetota bacterium]|nr:hypothetical protein [Planctomycetota bacterium]
MKAREPAEHGLLALLVKDGVAGVDAVVAEAVRRPEAVAEILAGLESGQARVKYGAAKVLRIVSEIAPAHLYPRLDRFIALLDSENSIFKWNAIFIVANLAGVDTENLIEGILPKYFAPIVGPVLITAANIIGGAARFVAARPRLADFVAREVLKVEQACYKTRECRNVALGAAIESLGRFFEHIRDRSPVIEMVRRQLKNTRSSTRKKAEQFLREHDPSCLANRPTRPARPAHRVRRVRPGKRKGRR